MAELTARELTPGFGAQVEGLDPRIPLDAATCTRLRELFDERQLLVFPGLDIGKAFQEYLAFMLIGQETPADEPSDTGAGNERRGYMMVSNKEPGGGAPYGRLLY